MLQPLGHPPKPAQMAELDEGRGLLLLISFVNISTSTNIAISIHISIRIDIIVRSHIAYINMYYHFLNPNVRLSAAGLPRRNLYSGDCFLRKTP